MSRTKIQVVDDEPDFVDLISFNLGKEGFEVLSAENGCGRAGFQASRLRAVPAPLRLLPTSAVLRSKEIMFGLGTAENGSGRRGVASG
jgi:CheY-like chemotaxis protein